MLSLPALSSFLPSFLAPSFSKGGAAHSPIILSLPTELILEIGEMLDTMSLINLSKTHPLFTQVLDHPSTSLIKLSSRRNLRTPPLPTSSNSSNHTHHYHYTHACRFLQLDLLLAPKKLCLHEINLLNYLVDAGLAISFFDAIYRFSTAIKSVTRYTHLYRHYRAKPWATSLSMGAVEVDEIDVFHEVETWLHRKHTRKALDRIAAVYSYVAEVVALKTGPPPPRQPARVRFSQSCCEGVKSWERIMDEWKRDPNYKERLLDY